MSPQQQPRAAAVVVSGRSDAQIRATIAQLSLHLAADSVSQLARRLQRDPTLAELTLVNSMWSEHCSYKSSKALLRTLPTQAPNVVLGPGADAGIVRLPRVDEHGRLMREDRGSAPDATCIAVAHESHNHPSQLLPYEGAATGIGGIVRDVYCMGADVVGVLDILRFGDPAGAQAETVRQILQGVVDGIAGYGNALGVPNLGGAVEFDAAFDDNCLVNVVAVGVLKERDIIPSRAPQVAGKEGYALMLVGKPTDDSGLGGAAFASGLLETEEGHQDRGAVQVPDPFFKRVLTEANRAAIALLRDRAVPFAIKDLGAAGFGGASSELAGDLGVRINLDAVHCDQPGRPPAVLMVAETQERYVFAVPYHLAEEIQDLYEKEFEIGAIVRGAGARVVGQFNESGQYQATHGNEMHVDLATTLIAEAWEVQWPHQARIPAAADSTIEDAATATAGRDLASDLQAVFGSVHGGSRYPIYAHFDSDVQGKTMFRPGDADAGIFLAARQDARAVAIGTGGPARLGKRDAWRSGATAVCEAARNVVAVGATPWALTDCLNFGSPETPHGMQDLVDAVRGLGDAARAWGLPGHPGSPLPFVSGNVSLYNESHSGLAIPPTPLVACFGVLADASRGRSSTWRCAGDVLFRLCVPQARLGASLWAQVVGNQALLQHGGLPDLDVEAQRDASAALLEAFENDCVSACHDIGDGGEIVALAEMAWDRRGVVRFGAQWTASALVAADNSYASLFDETAGFLCAVPLRQVETFTSILKRHAVSAERRGVVTEGSELAVQLPEQTVVIDLQALGKLSRHALEDVLETQEVTS